MNFKVTLLPGDGIGPEVTAAAVKVLEHAAERNFLSLEFEHKLIGGASYEKYGKPLTEQTLQACRAADAVFLGAVGGPQWEDLPQNLKPEAALLGLRKELGLYANLRPATVYSSFLNASSLKEEVLHDTDFVVVRELTGGIYFGEPRGHSPAEGWNTMRYSRPEVERIARTAFRLARQRRGHVTSVDKANVLECSQFWRDVVNDVHKDYSDVELRHMYVDNAAMQIVREPRQFDVLLTSNLFGDILSDISGMITGSLGMLPSASLGGDNAMYEPVHGSAPDIAGQDKANPVAAIASVAMMLEQQLQMTRAAQIIRDAIEAALARGYRTVDIAGRDSRVVGCDEMTSLILFYCEEIYNEEAVGVFTL